MVNWKILTLIFALLFVVMLIINIYQRQFILSDDEISALYNTTSEEIIIFDENYTVIKDYIQSHQFTLFYDSYIDLNFNSDANSNIYLFDNIEYLRYEEGEQSYYTERGLNTPKFYLTNNYLQAGDYVIVIESIDKEVNYHLKLVAK